MACIKLHRRHQRSPVPSLVVLVELVVLAILALHVVLVVGDDDVQLKVPPAFEVPAKDVPTSTSVSPRSLVPLVDGRQEG